MKKTSSKMLFWMITIMSMIMLLSSNNWISIWISMEMNLMVFIPLMFDQKNHYLSQSSMIYFLIQSMASMLLISFILVNKYMYMSMVNNFIETILMISMMMKLGIPPFHFWFPEIMSKINWIMCFMLMTWQKIGPMYIISMIIDKTHIMLPIFLSSILGSILGLNHTSIRKIMAYSSISHLGWMLACAKFFKKSWIIYLMFYSIIMLMMCMIMHKMNIMYINQLNNLMSINDKLLVFSMMLSMGGMPPFIGFIPKWMTIQYMYMSENIIMMMIMVMFTLITLFYYIRMSSSIMLIINSSQKWMMFQMNNNLNMSMLMINLMFPIIILNLNFW